jgi:hypothetical protein
MLEGEVHTHPAGLIELGLEAPPETAIGVDMSLFQREIPRVG